MKDSSGWHEDKPTPLDFALAGVLLTLVLYFKYRAENE